MIRYFFVVIFCCISITIYSKSHPLDSLRHAYLLAKGNTQINASIDYARKLPIADSTEALSLLQKAIKQARKAQYIKGEIRANHWLGWYYFENLHNPQQAIPLYKAAIVLALKHKDYDEAFWVYAILKDVHVFLSDYIEAIKLLNEEKDIANKVKRYHYLTSIQVGLLQCYGGVGDFRKAHEAFLQGITAAKKTNDSHTSWLLYSTMSEIKLQEKEPVQALVYLNKAIDIGRKTNEYYNVLNLQSKVNLLINFNQLASAEELCWAIRKRMKTIESFEFVGTNNASLSYIYLAQKDYYKALAYALLSYEETKQAGNEENLIKLDSTLFKIYQRMGDFKNAFNYSTHFITLNEKLLSKEKIKQFQNIQYRHEMNEKQQAFEHEQRVKQMYIFITVVLCLILVLLVIVLIIKQKNNQLQVKLLDEATKNEEQNRAKMQFEMDSKTRELTFMAMTADQKNVLWQNAQQKLKEKLKEMPSISEYDIRSIFKIITQSTEHHDEWATFKVHFESVHPQFFTTLSQIASNLTALELRQCAYIKINLSPKQVGSLLNITPDAVKKARMRIKKKLNLNPEDSLSKFIATIQG